MRIIIDADSCPRDIRQIIIKAGTRNAVPVLFVGNRKLPDISKPAENVLVTEGEGNADRYIAEHAEQNDLIITRDIPLAGLLLERGMTVINDRGDCFTKESIGERLSIRNHMKTLRERGLAPGLGGRQYGSREKKRFADTFNRELTRLRKKMDVIP